LEHSTLEKTLKSKVIQLRKAKKEAENANLLKTKFLANMSHEVRTPLNVILGLSEIVKSDAYANTNERNQMLTTINQNGYYLLDIIDNILEISLIDSNQLSYHIKSTNITSLFTEIKQIYRINTKSKIKVLFEPSNITQEQTFFTDETRLKQVIINLINNAIKYTNEGEVRVSYNNYKEGIKIMVKDTGVGIHPDNLKVIFNRFVKIDGEKELIQGTGLGLAISRSIVEALGGKIWVQSKLHIGSSFYIYLPNQDKKPALVSNDTYAKQ